VADLRLLILASRFQNAFFTELAHVLVEEIRRLGVPAHLLTEPAEIDSGDVLVALPPHEYVALEGDPWARDHGLRARTIGISAEQPGSSHFDENIALAASFGATFDFSAHAVAAYQRAGVVAHHLAFGWTPAWDRFHEHDATGPEVLFMGCATERRLHALSGLTRHLWSRRSRLIISDNATPNHRSSASFLTGDDKRSLLATTAVLVNIHQGTAPYFEWLRAAEAAHCGAVLLSEPSLHPEPFVPGEHFEAWTLSGMSSALDELLDDEDRLGRLRLNAYRMLREHPFQASVAKLLTVAEELPRRGGLRSVGPRRSTPLKPTTPTPWEHERGESDILRQAIREIRLDLAELRRAVLALERGTASADNVPSVSKSAVQQRAVTAPRVSVLMALYNHAPFVTAALDSVALNDFLDVELIVVDDGSTDGTDELLAGVADARMHCLRSEHVGAAEARNIGARAARARWLTFLDSDDTAAADWLSSMLAEARHPGTGLVSCGYTERTEGSAEVRRQPLPRPASAAIGPITELIETGGSYLVLRDLFLDVGGFDRDQPSSQHQELALRLGPELVERGLGARAVMRPLVDRWVGRADHIRGDDAAVLAGSVRILELHRERLARDPTLLANTAAAAAFRATRLGARSQARRLMLLAARNDPGNIRHWARLAALLAPAVAQRRALRRTPAGAR